MQRLQKLAILLLSSFVVMISGESCGDVGILQEDSNNMAFSISSKAFKQGDSIPQVYTCEGKSISPPLSWTDPPKGTKSMTLIMHDPDATRPGGFTHWVVFNIPPSALEISEAQPAQAKLENGSTQGNNGANRLGYTGPCPPSGTHRYFFYLYAVDETLQLNAGASEQQLRDAMAGHIIAQAQLEGLYQKQK